MSSFSMYSFRIHDASLSKRCSCGLNPLSSSMVIADLKAQRICSLVLEGMAMAVM